MRSPGPPGRDGGQPPLKTASQGGRTADHHGPAVHHQGGHQHPVCVGRAAGVGSAHRPASGVGPFHPLGRRGVRPVRRQAAQKRSGQAEAGCNNPSPHVGRPLSFLRSSIAQDILKSKYFLLFFDIFLLLFSDKAAKIRFVGAYFYGRRTLFILRAARGERAWRQRVFCPARGQTGKAWARENAAEAPKKTTGQRRTRGHSGSVFPFVKAFPGKKVWGGKLFCICCFVLLSIRRFLWTAPSPFAFVGTEAKSPLKIATGYF